MESIKECLWCKADISSKKETAKFCSTSCRVMHSRKFGKKGFVNSSKIEAMYNSMMSMMENFEKAGMQIRRMPPIDEKEAIAAYNTSHTEQFTHIEEVPLKSFMQHMNELADLETEYEYKRKAAEIEAASNLTRKQKDLLLMNMRKSNL